LSHNPAPPIIEKGREATRSNAGVEGKPDTPFSLASCENALTVGAFRLLPHKSSKENTSG
jgi:hypothetical protein